VIDLSSLSDDQLIELARLVIAEGLSRHPTMASATEQVLLDASEQLRIARMSEDSQIKIARALERERIANAASAAQREANQQAAARAAAEAAEIAANRERARIEVEVEAERALLTEAAHLLGKNPRDLNIVRLGDRGRLIINPGHDRFTRDHLVDWTTNGKLYVARGASTSRADIAAFAARAYALMTKKCLIGAELWPAT
jgi:hypothetical protein